MTNEFWCKVGVSSKLATQCVSIIELEVMVDSCICPEGQENYRGHESILIITQAAPD